MRQRIHRYRWFVLLGLIIAAVVLAFGAWAEGASRPPAQGTAMPPPTAATPAPTPTPPIPEGVMVRAKLLADALYEQAWASWAAGQISQDLLTQLGQDHRQVIWWYERYFRLDRGLRADGQRQEAAQQVLVYSVRLGERLEQAGLPWMHR